MFNETTTAISLKEPLMDIITRPGVTENQRVSSGRFITKYSSMSPEEVSWEQVCIDCENPSNPRKNCFRTGFSLILFLLRNNLYKRDHSEILYDLLPEFEAIDKINFRVYKDIMCGDKIEGLFFYKVDERNIWTYNFSQLGYKGRDIINDYLKTVPKSYFDRYKIPGIIHFSNELYVNKYHCMEIDDQMLSDLYRDQIAWIKANVDQENVRIAALRLMQFYSMYFESDKYIELHKVLSCFDSDFPQQQRITKEKKISDILSKSKKNLSIEGFWDEINTVKNTKDLLLSTKRTCILKIITKYRKHVKSNPENDIFGKSLSMSEELLFSPRLASLILDDYVFVTYGVNDVVYTKKICYIMRNMHSSASASADEIHKCIDFSSLSGTPYFELAVEYFSGYENNRTGLRKFSHFGRISEALNLLFEIKAKTCDAPDYYTFTLEEAEILRMNILYDSKLDWSSKNSTISAIRMFFIWANSKKKMQAESGFEQTMTFFGQTTASSPNAIPDDHLDKINNYVRRNMKKNERLRLFHTIFLLLLETEFRCGQICHLRTDCLLPGIKPGTSIIRSATKTSHGEATQAVVPMVTTKLIKEAIDFTDELRSSATYKSLKNQIFLYKDRNGISKIYETDDFNSDLSEICKNLGLPHYSTGNIRDTYMTKAYEFVLKNNKSDLEFLTLSGHTKVDTGSSFYITSRLTDMLEATYGVNIGDNFRKRIPDGALVDELPAEINDDIHTVENGCGKCKHDNCKMSTFITCLICKNFRTTIAHLPFFQHMVEVLDEMIRNAATQHDREDLLIIKKLHVCYIEKITKKIELSNDTKEG